MGEVYRAPDTALMRDVAVKTLPVDVADERRLARLQREGRVLAALNHPHIATLHDIILTVDGRPALVMELVCDLKPANITRRRDGQIKVLDFGLGRLGEPLDGDDLDNASTVTPDELPWRVSRAW